MTRQFTCPVCGYPELDEPPRNDYGGPSYEICPSCGFQFGYDDEDGGHTYESYRTTWIAQGMRWWSSRPGPRDWDAVRQLATVAVRDGHGSRPRPPEQLVGRLRAAGCVFAEDEAALIVEAGGDTEDLVARRVAGEPLEYVLGFVDLCGLRIALVPGVFIPRQRSAFMVRHAATLTPMQPMVLDLCCGSGALGLAVAHTTAGATLHAADLDPVAVGCAARNLRGLGTVVRSDLFEDVPRSLHGTIDLLLANVPYVASDDLDTLPVEAREHEPASTHDGGPDGLDVARRVLVEARDWLAPDGHLLIEIAEHQIDAATEAFTRAGLDVHVETDDDLGATVAVGHVSGNCSARSGCRPGRADSS